MTDQAAGAASGRSRRLEMGVAVAILAVVAILFSQTFAETSAFAQASQGRGPFFYPRFVMAGMAALAVAMLLRPSGAGEDMPHGPSARRALGLVAATAAYALGLETAGFLISSLAFTLLAPLLLGFRRIFVTAAVAAVFSVAVWWIFENVFLIILPRSPWFETF